MDRTALLTKVFTPIGINALESAAHILTYCLKVFYFNLFVKKQGMPILNHLGNTKNIQESKMTHNP